MSNKESYWIGFIVGSILFGMAGLLIGMSIMPTKSVTVEGTYYQESQFKTNCMVYLQGQVITTDEWLHCVDTKSPSSIRVEGLIDSMKKFRRVTVSE